MRVTIVGSKPISTNPGGDIVYFCNGAAALSGDFPDSLRKIHVASRNIFALEKKKSEASQARTQGIINSTFDRTVIFSKPDQGLAPGSFSKLSYRTHALEILDRIQQQKLIRDVAGITTLNIVWSSEFSTWKKLRTSFLATALKKDVIHTLRPSTGVLAILIAIRDFGIFPEYVVSRIGLASDGYMMGGTHFDVPRGHQVADHMILKKLSQSKFQIKTDVLEMHERYGFEMIL